MRRWVAAVAALALMLAAAAPALAVLPSERLADPKLEARARALSHELRCLVCQNENIDDSGADLAHDLRVLVRDRLKAGDSDEQTIAFVRARYGDFVLLRPPFQADTWLLWGGPLLILLLGGATLLLFYRRRQGAAPTTPLSAEERHRLAVLLDRDAHP